MDRNQTLNDLEAGLLYALDGRQARIWTAMPAKIAEPPNWDHMTVRVQPVIQGQYTDQNGVQTYIDLPPLLDCPLVFPSAGGFSLTLPVKAGDEVLVVIASRCIDAWWQNGAGSNKPMELRMHDLSDGFVIPGPKSFPNVISAISSENAQLRTDDGNTYIEITPGGAINLKASAGIGITGDLTVTGKVTATDEITAKSSGTAIPLSTHLHPGVMSGGADTGAPIP